MAIQTKEITPAKQSAYPVLLTLVPSSALFDDIQRLKSSIARRAFEIFESNGKTDGHDTEQWLTAESEFLHPVLVELGETNDRLTVRAEVPGFTAKEIEVAVEPRRLTISCKRESEEESKDQELTQERCSDRILQVIDLAAEVDEATAEATFQDGVLEVQVSKATPTKRIMPDIA